MALRPRCTPPVYWKCRRCVSAVLSTSQRVSWASDNACSNTSKANTNSRSSFSSTAAHPWDLRPSGVADNADDADLHGISEDFSVDDVDPHDLSEESADLKSDTPSELPALLSQSPPEDSCARKPITKEPRRRNLVHPKSYKPRWLYDVPTMIQSRLLDLALVGFLPTSSLVDFPEALYHTESGVNRKASTLPVRPGHHLVYFRTARPSSSLMPNGSESWFAPFAPAARKQRERLPHQLWLGGYMKFRPGGASETRHPLRPVACPAIGVERVSYVTAWDQPVVAIERRFSGTVWQPDAQGGRWRDPVAEMPRDLALAALQHPHRCGVIEERRVQFLSEAAWQRALRRRATSPPPGGSEAAAPPPAFAWRMTPTRTLLSRFSALTLNDHDVHLDRTALAAAAAGDADDGWRPPGDGLLVHGGLTPLLMLEVLSRHLVQASVAAGDKVWCPRRGVHGITYRNLAPLWAGEELKICGRERANPSRPGLKWDVWIEGPGGGTAVRGLVELARAAPANAAQPSTAAKWRIGQDAALGETMPPRSAREHAQRNHVNE